METNNLRFYVKIMPNGDHVRVYEKPTYVRAKSKTKSATEKMAMSIKIALSK